MHKAGLALTLSSNLIICQIADAGLPTPVMYDVTELLRIYLLAIGLLRKNKGRKGKIMHCVRAGGFEYRGA